MHPPGDPWSCIDIGNISFDISTREVSINGKVITTSRRKISVIAHLMRLAGRVVPKDVIEDTIYGFDDDIS